MNLLAPMVLVIFATICMCKIMNGYSTEKVNIQRLTLMVTLIVLCVYC